MIKTLRAVETVTYLQLEDVHDVEGFQRHIIDKLAQKLAKELLKALPVKVEHREGTRWYSIDLGVTTLEEAQKINNMLDLPIVQALLNPQADKPTQIKGIVIAGSRAEYHRWLEATGRDWQDYPRITFEEQLRGLNGRGLSCYLIDSYRESNFYTGEMENIIRSRGFRLTWE